jgi:3-deoxy-D-manno-octulosonate 8-phosphate phosphatase KdsC-like HAD superfamily phosphatase
MAASAICHAAEEVVTLPTRDGVKLSYLLLQDKSTVPKTVAVAFVGGPGAIGLAKRSESGPVKFGPGANFLVRIRDELGLPRERVLAIGDGANDLPMMAEAGTSIAYHAKPVVKAKADYALDYAGLDGVLTLFPASGGSPSAGVGSGK